MTDTKTKPHTNVRAYLELEDDSFVAVSALRKHPDGEAMAQSAFAVLAMQLKDALSGMSPLFNRENVLDLCRKIIEEDFNPDGPQTPSWDDLNSKRTEESVKKAMSRR
jgi:DNA-binding transcriptional regulator YhcF (GntR family)